MMNIVDSSCWLEVIEMSSIGAKVAPIVEDVENLIVPTIVLYEVFKKAISMKGFDYARGFIQGMLCSNTVPLDVELSINATLISRDYRLPTADSIIYATAKQYDAVLWTTDKHFDGLPNIRYFDKTKVRTG